MTQDRVYTEVPVQGQQLRNKKFGVFRELFSLRIMAGIAIGAIALWGFMSVPGLFEQPDKAHVAATEKGEPIHSVERAGDSAHHYSVDPLSFHAHASSHDAHAAPEHDAPHAAPGHNESEDAGHDEAQDAGHGEAEDAGHDAAHAHKAPGVHFVEAIIECLDYELNERFWGWRRNDIIRHTDNVENMQLGILEVVRRTTVNLTERISRHGPDASQDKNLENAINWLMLKPESYWFPSAEGKYQDALDELRTYAKNLEKGTAHFNVGTDNLIPLLLSFADLAGSCDDNLVKQHEEDGSSVSFFDADDYFYYAKGVGKAMAVVLHAVMEDFSDIINTSNAHDILHHAVHACQMAGEMEPWIITDASYDGILANHRANMAAEISHVRYFLYETAKALST